MKVIDRDYPAVQGYVRTFLEHANDQVAKLRIYVYSIRSASAVGDSAQAIEIGRRALASVGHRLPETAQEADAVVQEIRAKLSLSHTQLDVRVLLQIPSTVSFPPDVDQRRG